MSRRPIAAAFFVVSALLTAVTVGCSPADQSPAWPAKPGLKVLASFAPIQCLVMNVAGDDANVQVLFGDEGPHHIKDNPGHVKLFAGADVVYTNGLGLETRNVKTIQKATSKQVPVVALGDLLPENMRLMGGCDCCKDEDGKEGEHDHEHGDFDPHVWLGIDQAVKMVEAIRDDLQKRDPAHADNYATRATAYIAKLNNVKADGQAMMKDKSEKQFISFHDSLSYFAKNFGLKAPEVIQLVPGQEPTQKQLTSLMDRCEKKKIRVIAIEPQYGSGTSAKAVADALKVKGLSDVQMIVVDPLETTAEGEFNAGWYEAKMRANLEALAKALK
ncbi:metal ABC transporter substrate-binding protein [Limnoglobus roseus]|uniref:Zinc ABC transporter substrate-binding protein n=1 Tax=Limnoglobus roseus TaxID=2598579 RepID=A0A5C1AIU9_9BACT|nr:metal ABC transporter substrate-binding protein [Limnoglobus roseus]QEL18077.1 zinc ABC transporter substrate-binding protein [Limnoglobus roseus]